MIIYWILFALPGIFYVTERRFSASLNQIVWVATAAVFAFFIGFRHEVGCDWYGYYSTYEALASSYTYTELFTSPGFISREKPFKIGFLSIFALRLFILSIYPTLPSRLIPTNFCASTANSIGNCCNTSLQKPLTINPTASSEFKPLC